MRGFVYALLLLIAVLSPWGDLQRVGDSLGVTTVLGCLAVLAGVASGRVLEAMRAYRPAVLFPAFLLMAGLVSVFTREPTESFWLTLTLAAYFLLAFTVSSLRLDDAATSRLLGVFAASAAVMCAVSLLDHYGFAAAPGFNEGAESSDFEDIGLVFLSMSGPFSSRNLLAVPLCLALPVAATFALFPGRPAAVRLLWLGCALLLGFATALTLSRGAYVGVAASFAYVLYAGDRRRRVPRVLQGLVAAATCVVLLAAFAPDVFDVVRIRFDSIRMSEMAAERGDALRFDALEQTWKDLGTAPLGLGFTNPSVAFRQDANVHSNFTLVLRAAGPVGLLLVVGFLWPLLRRALRPGGDTLRATLFASLLCFAVFGLTHTTLFAVFAWVVLGCALRLEAAREEVEA